MLTRTMLTITVALTAVAGAQVASGQGLSDAIAELRRQRAMEEASKAELSPKQKILQKLFYQELSVDFQETEARDAFEYLKTALDLNLIARYSDDAAGHGIDPHTPITLEAKDVPAIEVLEQVLEQCAAIEPCTWQVRSSYLEVGTKARLASDAAMSVRVYPVSDLLMDPPEFNDAPSLLFGNPDYLGSPYYGGGGYLGPHRGVLRGGYGGSVQVAPPGQTRQAPARSNEEAAAEDLIEAIVNIVEPTAWSRNGGDWATIKYTRGTLIVRAPDFIQRQLFGYPRVPPPIERHVDEEDGNNTDAAVGGASDDGGDADAKGGGDGG